MHSLLLADGQDYPALNIFWTMLWLFLWILWLFLVFRIITDIFRSKDLGGWGKAGWSLFVIVLPFLGVLSYVIVRGSSMQTREQGEAQQSEEAFRSYVQEAAGTGDISTQLTKLADLRDRGVLTDQEFAAQKAKLLS